MIRFCPMLYIDPAFEESEETLRAEIMSYEIKRPFYLAVFSEHMTKAEVLPSALLLQDYYKKQNLSVFGIAATKENGEGLLAQAYFDALTEQNTVDLRAYVGEPEDLHVSESEERK